MRLGTCLNEVQEMPVLSFPFILLQYIKVQSSHFIKLDTKKSFTQSTGVLINP